MCVPELPNFKELEALGVKRISMGNFLYEAMLSSLQKNLITIKREQSFRALF
jgi:2-methylisocitrate lyase-like PEP mutase family enzyme